MALSIERLRGDALTARDVEVSSEGAELSAKCAAADENYTTCDGRLKRGSDVVARLKTRFQPVTPDGVLPVNFAAGSGRPQKAGVKMREPGLNLALFLQQKHLRDRFPEWDDRQEER